MKIHNMENKEKYLCAVIIGLSLVLLFARSFLGFDWSDEPFYTATANRFYLGDKLIVDEWNPAQIASVLLLPLLTGYRTIVGSTDGIILFFRLCYFMIIAVSSLFMYQILVKLKNRVVSLLSTLLYMYYARFCIATLSYNTIAVCFLMLAILIIFYNLKNVPKKLQCFLAGIFYSIAVVATPHLAVSFVFYAIVLIVFILKCRKSEHGKTYKTILIFSLLGVLCSVVVFLLYLFSKVSLAELEVYLPNFFMEPGYIKASFLIRIISVAHEVYHKYIFTMIPYLITIFVCFYSRIKCRQWSNGVENSLYAIQIIILGINIFISGFGTENIGICFIAISMFGFYLYVMNIHRDWLDIGCWYAMGLVIAVCFFLSSNTGIYAIAMGCLFSSIATIMVIDDVIRDKKNSVNYILKMMTGVCLIAVLCITMCSRLGCVYRDDKITNLNVRIEQGPAKGLYTSPNNKMKYDQICDVIYKNIRSNDKVFFTKLLPWGYLCTDAECAAYSTWRTFLNGTRIEQYYQMKPDKIPTVVLVVKDGYGCSNENNPYGEYMRNLLESGDYCKKEYDCGVLFRRIK